MLDVLAIPAGQLTGSFLKIKGTMWSFFAASSAMFLCVPVVCCCLLCIQVTRQWFHTISLICRWWLRTKNCVNVPANREEEERRPVNTFVNNAAFKISPKNAALQMFCEEAIHALH